MSHIPHFWKYHVAAQITLYDAFCHKVLFFIFTNSADRDGNAALCGISSGSSLFALVPVMKMVNGKCIT